jgi:hypothetical protein
MTVQRDYRIKNDGIARSMESMQSHIENFNRISSHLRHERKKGFAGTAILAVACGVGIYAYKEMPHIPPQSGAIFEQVEWSVARPAGLLAMEISVGTAVLALVYTGGVGKKIAEDKKELADINSEMVKSLASMKYLR